MSVFGTGLVGGMSGENETFTVVAKSGTLSKLTLPCNHRNIDYFTYYQFKCVFVLR